MGSFVQSLPRSLRRWVRRLRDVPTRFREWPGQRRHLGPRAARQLGWSAFRHPIGDPSEPPGPLDALDIAGLAYPFWFRHGTSDVPAIRQLFVQREYQFLERLTDVHTILDVGANIGAAAVFLLHLFPEARLIAVEPAEGNFAVLEKNLAPYGERGRPLRAAAWPTPATLQLQRGFRDGLDWSIQVREATGESTGIEGVTIAQILERHQLRQLDLLKIDIEGAERELFRGDTAWLRHIRNICIELHDDDCRRAFDDALQGFTYERETRGETTLCTNLRPK